jgi:hypothetical protein
MALSATLVKKEAGFSGELVMPDVYFKVAHLVGDKNRMTASIVGTKDGATVFAGEFSFPVELKSSKNFIAQAYEHAKTLPEFADAKDA